MVAEAEQDRFTGGEVLALVNGVAIALLFVLDGEGDAFGQRAHLPRLFQEVRIFGEPVQVALARTLEVVADGGVGAGLHDDADFLDARRHQFQQVVMDQGPRHAVLADDRKQLLLHGMGCREMTGAETGGGNNGFADGCTHVFVGRWGQLVRRGFLGRGFE